MSMYGICTGIASGSWRSACSGLSKSGRRWSAVLFPDEGGEFPGDWQAPSDQMIVSMNGGEDTHGGFDRYANHAA